jgi:CRISPR-associated protein Cas2
MRLWVIAYDIADDKRRRYLVKCLSQKMQRVQESVFEAWLTQSELSLLIVEATPLLNLQQDRLRAYPLAVRTEQRYGTYGQQQATMKHSNYWIIG